MKCPLYTISPMRRPIHVHNSGLSGISAVPKRAVPTILDAVSVASASHVVDQAAIVPLPVVYGNIGR